MRKVLYILGQLDDLDVDWIAETGLKRRLNHGAELIREGESIETMYIVLEGRLLVDVSSIGTVAELGVGEIVGEISFVDSAPPSASVRTDGNATVLELRRAAVEARLKDNDGFGHRFYKALAMFLADRLRTTVSRLGYGEAGRMNQAEIMEDEIDDRLLDSVSLAGDQFDRLIKRLQDTPSID